MSDFNPLAQAILSAPARSTGQATSEAPPSIPAFPDYYTLKEVNRFINEDFRLPSGLPLRDCEWFSHFKRQKLRESGFDGQLLDVETETSDKGKPNHRVLVVGEWVLDNREKNPYKRSSFKRMGYKEYPDNPGTPR